MVRPQSEIRRSVEHGEAIYDASIKDQLSDDQLGLFLAIDTNTGEYEVGDSSMAVTDALHARGRRSRCLCHATWQDADPYDRYISVL